MIRDGREKDLNHIVEMARDFWKKSQFSNEPFDDEMVEAMAKESMRQELMKVLQIENNVVGFCCGIAGPLLANADIKIGTELAWWVEPEYRSGGNGLKLLKGIEEAAKKIGCKYWNMIFMETSMPKEIEKIYQKSGYALGETIYTKRLK